MTFDEALEKKGGGGGAKGEGGKERMILLDTSILGGDQLTLCEDREPNKHCRCSTVVYGNGSPCMLPLPVVCGPMTSGMTYSLHGV